MAAFKYAEFRAIGLAMSKCVGSEIVRMRRGLPHRSWLNRFFQKERGS